MKLLPLSEIKDEKQAMIARDIIRIQEVEETTKRMNAELAKAKADFATTLSEQRSRWEKEAEQHERDVREMSDEVNVLEKRKERALIPIEIYKKQADTLLGEAQIAMAKAEARKDELDELQELLEERLTEVGDREQKVKQEENRQRLSKESIERQKDSIIEGTKQLNQHIADFLVVKEQADKDIEERKKALVMWDRTNLATKESYEVKFKELEGWAIRLADERHNLDEIYKEIKRIPPSKEG